MKFCKEDEDMHPVKDWCKNSPLLIQLNWTNRLMAALINAKISLYGIYDSNKGGYMTSKKAIITAIMLRNQHGLGMKIDLDYAYSNLWPVPILTKV